MNTAILAKYKMFIIKKHRFTSIDMKWIKMIYEETVEVARIIQLNHDEADLLDYWAVCQLNLNKLNKYISQK